MIIAYLALTTAYTYRLKAIPVLDIVAVAAGFVLRAIGGATATGVPISEWFFIVTSFGALFMVAGKREGETRDLAGDASTVRPALDAYTPTFLAYLRAVFSGGTLVAYCLWAFSSAESRPDGAFLFQLSIVPFAIAILRYALLLDQGRGAEPEKLIMSDRIVLGCRSRVGHHLRQCRLHLLSRTLPRRTPPGSSWGGVEPRPPEPTCADPRRAPSSSAPCRPPIRAG